MDGDRFDTLTMSWTTNRRSLLRLLMGGLSVLIALLGTGDAQAARRRHHRRRRRPPSICAPGQSLCFVSALQQCRRVCRRTRHGRRCRQECSPRSTLVCLDTQANLAHCGACDHNCLAVTGPGSACLGGVCTAPVSPPVSPPPPPPPPGTPACVAYGGACTQATDCCSGVPCTGFACRYP